MHKRTGSPHVSVCLMPSIGPSPNLPHHTLTKSAAEVALILGDHVQHSHISGLSNVSHGIHDDITGANHKIVPIHISESGHAAVEQQHPPPPFVRGDPGPLGLLCFGMTTCMLMFVVTGRCKGQSGCCESLVRERPNPSKLSRLGRNVPHLNRDMLRGFLRRLGTTHSWSLGADQRQHVWWYCFQQLRLLLVSENC